MQLTDTLREEHGIPIQSIYQENGFVFCVKKADLEDDLPQGFINVVSKGTRFLFSSVELASETRSSSYSSLMRLQKKRNARLKDALEEALFLSAK